MKKLRNAFINVMLAIVSIVLTLVQLLPAERRSGRQGLTAPASGSRVDDLDLGNIVV